MSVWFIAHPWLTFWLTLIAGGALGLAIDAVAVAIVRRER